MHKLYKYGSEGGWGVIRPFLNTGLIRSIAVGVVVAIGVELLQRKAFFEGVIAVDGLTKDGIA